MSSAMSLEPKMSKNVNKLDYLKKYLAGSNKDDGKRKKKRSKVKGSGMKIIDDDVDISKMRHLDDNELEILGGGEDAPMVVGIIDERPEHVKVAEHYSRDKWKVIAQDDGFNSSISVQDVGTRNKNSHAISKDSSDSDLSPVRNKNTDNKTKSSGGEGGDQVKIYKDIYRKQSPTRTTKQGSDSDLSPPRKTKTDHSKNQLNSKKHGSDSKVQNENMNMDKSRRTKNRWDSDGSQDSDSDMSPPRRTKTDRSMNQLNSKKLDTYSKVENERMNKDRSKLKKSRWDSDDSQSNRNGDDSRKYDQSRNYENKMQAGTSKQYKSSESRNERAVEPKRMERTLDGKKAGLQNAKHLKEETQEFRRKEDELFGKLSEDLTGRHAKAIKRNLGKRETSEDREKQKEKEEKQKELNAKYDRWGKGIKQIEEHEARVKDYMHEAAKPMARYRDDRDLEYNLRKRERDGDPMLEYIRKKEKERGETSGEPAHPVYKGPFPPNRFNIRPGHRWDGVDRSNGHEKNYFAANSKRVAMEAEKYKWSTEDM